MKPLLSILSPLQPLLLATALLLPSVSLGKASTWKELNGTSFQGECLRTYGPYVLFKTKNNRSKLVPFSHLSAEDCVRVHKESAASSGEPVAWGKSEDATARELVGRLARLQDGKLVPADVSTRPTPDFIVAFFGSRGNGDAWAAVEELRKLHTRCATEQRPQVSIIFFSRDAKESDHIAFVRDTGMPWLIADYSKTEFTEIKSRYSDAPAPLVVVFARGGVPLFQSTEPKKAAVEDCLKRFVTFLDLQAPNAVASFKERYYYWANVQPVLHQGDTCGPTMIGSLLNVRSLKEEGLGAFSAQLQISAQGRVENAELTGVPPSLTEKVTEGLRRSLFVPAIDHGKAVAGTYTYNYQP
jgi:hypothetical protein